MSADPLGSPAWLAEQRREFERYQLMQERAEFELLKASLSGSFYKLIADDAVDVSRRRIVAFVLPLMSEHLELASPMLSWFSECSGHDWHVAQREGRGGYFRSDAGIWGRARQGVVALNAETPLSTITATLAHEARHCYQSTLPGFSGADRDALEADATSYAARWQSSGRCLALAIAGLPHGKEGP